MREAQVRTGAHVRFKMGTRWVHGRVTEDRGPIGIKGRHLYLVEFDADPDSPSRIELPAEDLEAARGAVVSK